MRKNRLFRLLDAELLDAQDDIRDLEMILVARCEAREITNYVYRENTALMVHELQSLERIRNRLEILSPEEYADLETLRDAVMEMVHDQVLHHGVPGAVESIVRRRLNRIAAFLSEPEVTSLA